MDHHDEYDSITRQRKNYTIREVKRYREELYLAIKNSFEPKIVTLSSLASNLPQSNLDLVTGHYLREDDEGIAAAEIMISRLIGGKYHIEGHALWGLHRESGPNMGDFDTTAELIGNILIFTYFNFSMSYSPHSKQEELPYELRLYIENDKISASENDGFTPYGVNVRFSGQYTKVSSGEKQHSGEI
ncbi:hypothetical protein [Deinococcus arenicola]|uniref:Uncharacterized protein n=1 Tax=Deinococcus arenicola TaxID=2994950 RepID=A0ABU4DRI0_9DEIO|nr:hypothetical protein [Deinococcus sp. ZS9-10]MDV6375038.1 hypothetical protein [Deinococcus sp. ZS9-10]